MLYRDWMDATITPFSSSRSSMSREGRAFSFPQNL